MQVEFIFPTTTLALGKLKNLALRSMSMNSFSDSMAAALKQLTKLDLSRQDFSSLPSSISNITTLQIANFSQNDYLQLGPHNIDTLAALPSLQALSLASTDNARWSSESAQVLIDIAKKLPMLDLVMSPYR